MKKIKNALILGIILTVSLQMVACDKKEETKVEPDVKQEESVKSEEASLEYESSQVFENPELLKEITGKEASYNEYLKSSPMRVLFLDSESNLTDQIEVYSMKGAEDSTSLYIYYKKDKIVDAKLDEFNGDVNIDGYEYDTILYNYDNFLDLQVKESDFPYDLIDKKEDAQKELKEKFEGKDISEYQEFIKVYSPAQIFMKNGSNKSLQVYPVISELGYTASLTVNMIVEENLIKEVYIDELYKPSKNPMDVIK